MDSYNVLSAPNGEIIQIKPAMQDFLLDHARHRSINRETLTEQLPFYFSHLAEKVSSVLAQRPVWQTQIDTFYRNRREQDLPENPAVELAFLRSIGYIPSEKDGRAQNRDSIDDEIILAGLESVSPLMDDNMALGGANGRWVDYVRALGSSNIVKGPHDVEGVCNEIFALLKHVPLKDKDDHQQTWENVANHAVVDGEIVLTLQDGTSATLADPTQFIGYTGDAANPASLVFKHHGLHIEPKFDKPESPLARFNGAKISGCEVEANIKGIQDLEDGSSIVGTEDELRAYNVRLQLDKGVFAFQRAGDVTTRRMADNREYLAPDGTPVTLRGRTLMQTRVRGLLMKTDSILDQYGRPIPEFLQDLLVAGLSGKHDIEKADDEIRNSNAGKIYVVVPKLHGPEETALVMEAKRYVEMMCDLPKHTIKIFMMDEDVRTSLTLEQCIAAGIDPTDGINDINLTNTGFLDWTGQYAHTFLEKGDIAPKGVIKAEALCLNGGYEPGNVFTAVNCGLDGIGKGMATLTRRADMGRAAKYAHAEAGANASWPHSPMAGATYIIAFHDTDVRAIRHRLALEIAAMSATDLAEKRDEYRLKILTFPYAQPKHLTPGAVYAEAADNIFGELAYAKPWIDEGKGCVEVENKAGDKVMEDCATELIATGMMRNRLRYGRITLTQVQEITRAQAASVDERNSGARNYRPMADDFDNNAAAQAIVTMNADTDRAHRNVQPYLYPARNKVREAAQPGAGS